MLIVLGVVIALIIVLYLIYLGAHAMDHICDYFIPERKDK